jgi:hypothetical protein
MTPLATDEAGGSRAQKIAGLRQLIDALAADETIPLPYELDDSAIHWYVLRDREAAAAVVQGLPCAWQKTVRDGDDPDGGSLDMAGTLGGPAGLDVKVTVNRSAVCHRRVVGTEEVEVDEVVTPAVVKKVKETRDVVVWNCRPILSAQPDSLAAVTPVTEPGVAA